MYIAKNYDFYDLKNNVWEGAAYTLEKIIQQEKVTELMNLLDENFQEEIPTITEVNDFLWFEDENVFEKLGIEYEKER